MKTFFKHLLIDYKISLRDRTLLLMSYLFPLTFFLFMGFVMTSVNPTYKEIMFPSMLLFSLLTATVLIVPNIIVANRETGIYRSFKIYGIKRKSVISLIIISNFINVLVVSIIIGLISGLYFKVAMPQGFKEWISLIFAMVLVWFVFISLAIFLGNIVKNSKHVVMYTQLVFLPSILLGGVMINIDILPDTMQKISMILPTSHAMNIISEWSYGYQVIMNSVLSVIVLIAMGIIFIILDFITFKYDNQTSK